MQIILGLDQGTKKCGYSIFIDGNLSSSGVFLASEKFPIEEREIIIYEQIKNAIIKNHITYVVLEEVTLQGGFPNVKLFRDLARLQGMILVACHDNKIPYTILYPATWRNRLGFKGVKRDICKANAVAYCNEHFSKKFTIKDDDESEAIGIVSAFFIMEKES